MVAHSPSRRHRQHRRRRRRRRRCVLSLRDQLDWTLPSLSLSLSSLRSQDGKFTSWLDAHTRRRRRRRRVYIIIMEPMSHLVCARSQWERTHANGVPRNDKRFKREITQLNPMGRNNKLRLCENMFLCCLSCVLRRVWGIRTSHARTFWKMSSLSLSLVWA